MLQGVKNEKRKTKSMAAKERIITTIIIMVNTILLKNKPTAFFDENISCTHVGFNKHS